MMRIVLMGVSGSGKSSIGAALSKHLGIAYVDGDDLHTPANVEKMRAGIPLTDEDRWPWLDRVARVLADQAPVIIGCSALRRVYRDRIRAGAGGTVRFVHLSGSREVLAKRMAARPGHYMPVSLLDSQFATLEPPAPEEKALTVDIARTPAELTASIAAYLQGAEE
ncbi:MAG: gluconokinase [Paracoccus sp. (in: a-proteobacteria)]|uniref:gluconokinase n=1 Tax=Paracoccus sp. TaxID=267 RepID=UPI0039E49882